MRQYHGVLRESTLFRGVKKEEFEKALDCLGVYFKSYHKNQIIRGPETAVTEIGVVLEGIVYVTKTDINGNRMIFDELSAGKTFGESLAFAGAVNSPITIVAARDASVAFVPVKRILGTCSECCTLHAHILKNSAMLLAEKNMLLQIKNDILSQKTTREKLLLYFEYKSRTAGSKAFCLQFSREELADFLGLNASAISRELGRMRDEGLISYHRNKFVLKENLDIEIDFVL